MVGNVPNPDGIEKREDPGDKVVGGVCYICLIRTIKVEI